MGKKRQVIQVDEEKLKMMMAGEIPIKADPEKDMVVIEKQAEKAEVIIEQPIDKEIKEEQPVLSSSDKEPQKNIRRKKNKQSYQEIFLRRTASIGGKRQTTINLDEENYTNIMKILKITEGVGLGIFINNLLYHHFETNEEEILEIQQNYINQLFNR